MTIVEFLQARLDEDEQAARDAAEETGHDEWIATGLECGEYADQVWKVAAEHPDPNKFLYLGGGLLRQYGHRKVVTHVARQHPARVLAETEAKRQIIDLAAEASSLDASVDTDRRVGDRDPAEEPFIGDRILRQLGVVYSDHPDYNPAWRP